MPLPRFVLATLLPLGLVAPFAVMATELPGGAAYIKAADAVIAAQGQAGQTPPPPASDPRVQALLVQVSDIDAVFGHATLTAADMEPVMELCGRSNRIAVGYTLANIVSLKLPPGQSADTLPTRVAELGSRNTVVYQDIVMPLLAFSARCSARMMPLMVDFFTHLPAEQRTPIRMGGLRQMRKGLAGAIAGAVATTSQEGISPQNRHLAASAAADVAPTFAAIMPVADRKVLQQVAIHGKALAAPADQASLERVAHAFADEQCEGLCLSGN